MGNAYEEEQGAQGAGSVPVLYNLATDPGEVKDASADRPEIVARLQATAAELEGEIKLNRRPAGQVRDIK